MENEVGYAQLTAKLVSVRVKGKVATIVLEAHGIVGVRGLLQLVDRVVRVEVHDPQLAMRLEVDEATGEVSEG